MSPGYGGVGFWAKSCLPLSGLKVVENPDGNKCVLTKDFCKNTDNTKLYLI